MNLICRIYIAIYSSEYEECNILYIKKSINNIQMTFTDISHSLIDLTCFISTAILELMRIAEEGNKKISFLLVKVAI